MGSSESRERKGKRLLVAAIGVATISYASSQGCEPEPTMTTTSGNLLPPPADAGPTPPAQDAAPARDASLPTSGNLLPPPLDASLPTSGNLLPPPADAGRAKDAAVIDSSLPTSGNLLPPPRPKTP